MPRFSVIIPMFNKADYIQRSINSVLQQNLENFELLIVNDCSTDESLTLAKEIKDARITILQHDVNKGLSAARNTGIACAKGEIITFLDADDEWKPFFLSSIETLSKKFPECDIYGTDYDEKINNHIVNPVKNLPASTLPNHYVKIDDFFTASLFNPIYCYSCVAFSRKALEKIGDFNTQVDIGEDLDFNIRANTQFQLAYYYKACAMYYVDIPHQMTTSTIQQKRLIDFKKFDRQAESHSGLKKYLNASRYYYASQFKNQQNKKLFKKFMREIDFSQLSFKQELLLKSPYWLYKKFKKAKSYLIKRGVKITPY
ncbi:glycosyltransferase family 2 protein [Mesonia ostreae]|uniref:Glycosyltransferase family 2 protein n=1 Tax=Mesonia ostreae TaxID=861110 RepID=A0ABU2KKV3_9FLAO|nr:glycosyltransferase family 2 protein [Mesonia ostreae]MDT0295340.1 glycosyltransferase family 2 protein [Mesonia ostreae]